MNWINIRFRAPYHDSELPEDKLIKLARKMIFERKFLVVLKVQPSQFEDEAKWGYVITSAQYDPYERTFTILESKYNKPDASNNVLYWMEFPNQFPSLIEETIRAEFYKKEN